MKKMVFIKPNELNQLMTEWITAQKGTSVTCTVGYSESLEVDAVTIAQNGQSEDFPLEQYLMLISDRVGMPIQAFDVAEVGDDGEGFIFS